MPTSASTRRTPEPTEDSPVIATGPICDECSTWVPPQSSTRPRAADLDDPDGLVVGLAEQRDRAHRLGLGLRAVEHPDRQVLPDRPVGDLLELAAGLPRDSACSRRSPAAGSRACCRSRPAAPPGRAPGAAPRAPRGCRSAPAGRRAATPGRPWRAPSRPSASSPSVTRTRCTISFLSTFCTSSTSAETPLPRIDAGVGVLAAGLGVERGRGPAPARPSSPAVAPATRARRRGSARARWPRTPARSSR